MKLQVAAFAFLLLLVGSSLMTADAQRGSPRHFGSNRGWGGNSLFRNSYPRWNNGWNSHGNGWNTFGNGWNHRGNGWNHRGNSWNRIGIWLG
uniref:Uncharacterized protein n=1 Tax=Plectus sambesii TaxID=2011161 RepID=A0A914VDF5_9BILA